MGDLIPAPSSISASTSKNGESPFCVDSWYDFARKEKRNNHNY